MALSSVVYRLSLSAFAQIFYRARRKVGVSSGPANAHPPLSNAALCSKTASHLLWKGFRAPQRQELAEAFVNATSLEYLVHWVSSPLFVYIIILTPASSLLITSGIAAMYNAQASNLSKPSYAWVAVASGPSDTKCALMSPNFSSSLATCLC